MSKTRALVSSDWSDMARPEDSVSFRNMVPKSGSALDSIADCSRNTNCQPLLSPD